ncbi:MAG TPA: tyrosine-type recombinase/integrase [Steroidobacteraceae bacterium]|nr:tyrosine-type recombinase/integrase [Steroidobacteraceae bacterium]
MQAGTPLEVVQKLGGWASVQMTQRYAHLPPGHLAGYVAAFGQRIRLGGDDSATAQEAAA